MSHNNIVPGSVETQQCCRFVPCSILEVRTVVSSVVLRKHLVLALFVCPFAGGRMPVGS